MTKLIKSKLKDIALNQDGAIIATALLIIALLAAGGFGYWWISNEINDISSDTIEEGASEVRNYFGVGCWIGEPIGVQSGFLDSGEVFTAQDTMIITELQLRAGRSNTGTTKWRAVIYTWDSVEEEVIESIGSSIPFGQEDIGTWKLGVNPLADLPTVFISFYDDVENQVLLLEGVDYAYQIEYYSGTGLAIYNEQMNPTPSCTAATLGSLRSSAYYDGYARDYWVTGYETQEPTVTTVGSEVRTDGSVWLSGWTEVIADMNVGFFMSEVEETVEAGAGVRFDCGNTGLDQSRYFFQQRVVSILSDVTYYYRAYAELDGQYWYGETKSFLRLASDILPLITCNVHEIDVESVSWETSLVALPAETTWNVSIYYGYDLSECVSHNYSITVDTDVTADGNWLTEVPASYFDTGRKYWYQACAVEELGTTVCSPAQTLVTYNPSQPSVINWIATTFKIDFNWLWWAIIILGLFVVWWIAGYSKWWWLGIIGTGVAMIALISFGYVNAWVVVLLAIVVGWIVFKLVFRQSGGTSS